MCVCVHMCVCVYVHVCVCVCMHVHVRMCLLVCVWRGVWVCMHVGDRGREREEGRSLRASGMDCDLFRLFFFFNVALVL